MKVEDLILRLQRMPQEDEVVVDGLILEPVGRVDRIREGLTVLFLEQPKKYNHEERT